ncbi:Uncharacterised protein [Mycobacteroides abscessus subsp. abscessus]|nr:Uncharacterised protein [Mycobacteroides abscessus subsp. abscessus]
MYACRAALRIAVSTARSVHSTASYSRPRESVIRRMPRATNSRTISRSTSSRVSVVIRERASSASSWNRFTEIVSIRPKANRTGSVSFRRDGR